MNLKQAREKGPRIPPVEVCCWGPVRCWWGGSRPHEQSRGGNRSCGCKGSTAAVEVAGGHGPHGSRNENLPDLPQTKGVRERHLAGGPQPTAGKSRLPRRVFLMRMRRPAASSSVTSAISMSKRLIVKALKNPTLFWKISQPSIWMSWPPKRVCESCTQFLDYKAGIGFIAVLLLMHELA